MNARHERSRIVKMTLIERDITFLNVPAETCHCGELDPVYGEELIVVEKLAERVVQAANGTSVTVDYDKVNPLLVEELLREYQDEFKESLAKSTHKLRRPLGLSHEQLEAILLAALDKPDLSIPDCRTLVTTQ